jgi:transposase
VTTVKRSVAQLEHTGSLQPKPIPGMPRRIRGEQETILRERLQAAPDATVAEHCVWWQEHHGQAMPVPTMWLALGRDPYKKPLAASERDEAARAAWRAAIATRDPRPFVFVDESGTTIALTRLYGWAPHHQRAVGATPRNHGKNTTLVAARTPNGMQAPWAIEGAINTPALRRRRTGTDAPAGSSGHTG